MGKKSKQKQIRRSASPVKKTAQPVASSPRASRSESGVLEVAATLAERPSARGGMNTDYAAVRGDIKRIALLLVVMISLLVAAIIVNSRSSALQHSGARIASFLQLH